MEIEHFLIYLVRLGLLMGSGFLIPNQLIKAKRAWKNDDEKQLKRSFGYLWTGVLYLLLAVRGLGIC